MQIGDPVVDKSGLKGRVVALIDQDQFSSDFPKDEWDYLKRGILVETEEIGLVYFESPDGLTQRVES